MTDPAFNYIIVGGGSAGVVMAARLSEDSECHVLLVEAGADYRPGQEPAAIRDTFHTAVYRAENMWPGLQVHWGSGRAPTGGMLPARRYEQARIMGGGSSVNAMAAIRGVPQDYDDWERGGAIGWSWRDCLPYFVKLEDDRDFSGLQHGKGGPIPVRRNPKANWPPFSRAVADQLAAEGFPYVEDLNADFRDGLCAIPVSSLPSHRVSTARGYLTSTVRARPNLTLLSRTLTTALILEGRQAVGIVTRAASGAEQSFAGHEIIISAGALHTPALLMRAGIGPGQDLHDMQIPVIHDLQGVGQNLQDHPAVALGVHLKRMARQTGKWRPAPNVSLRYSSHLPDCPPADCWMSIANKTSWHPLGRRIAALGISIYKPFSRGSVRLVDPDPMQEPLIAFNMLSDPRDLARLELGLRKAAQILRAPEVEALSNAAFLASFSERIRELNRYGPKSWVRSLMGTWALDGPAPLRRWLIANVIAPGAEVEPVLADQNRLVDWLSNNVTGFYHPVGTCRMGTADDPLAVADPEGRVHGVENLRVVDASLMPTIPRANTNIPTIMIAEKIADAMRGRTRTVSTSDVPHAGASS
jgi:5-(hydroxymethyl)furfural/furfural oxidase